jgi:hypothetical protein
MLTQYRIILACLILNLGATAQASKFLNDEDTPPQNTTVHTQETKKRKSDLNPMQLQELEKRIFWAFEKNPIMEPKLIEERIKTIYSSMGIHYDEPKIQTQLQTPGCWF